MNPPERHTRVSLSAQSGLLTGILSRVAQLADRERPTVVFDLDSTLLDNRPRTLGILGELADAWESDHAAIAQAIRSLVVDDLAFLVDDSLASVGVRSERLLQFGRQHWVQRFFSNSLLHLDRPYPGAVQFAKACHDAGATVIYYTARERSKMATGTVTSLCAHGFPFAIPRVELVMKPVSDTTDNQFKKSSTTELARIGRVIATFDNEPHHCNSLKEAFPEASVCLIDTQHFPGAPQLDPGIVALGGFKLEH